MNGAESLVRTLMAGGIDKQRKKRHVKHDRFRIEQRYSKRLSQIVVRLNMQHRCGVWLSEEHLAAQPSEVGGPHPLHGIKSGRVCAQQRSNSGHGQPH